MFLLLTDQDFIIVTDRNTDEYESYGYDEVIALGKPLPVASAASVELPN